MGKRNTGCWVPQQADGGQTTEGPESSAYRFGFMWPEDFHHDEHRTGRPAEGSSKCSLCRERVDLRVRGTRSQPQPAANPVHGFGHT